MATVEDAENDRDRARADAEAALVDWRSAQSQELRDFLVDEATATAKTQHSVTLKLGPATPEFKASTTEAAEAAAASFLKWASSLTVDQILNMPGSLREAFQDEATTAVAPWAELFIQAGYDPGTRAGYDYRRLRESPKWLFYHPETVGERHPYFPLGKPFKKLGDAMDRYKSSIKTVENAKRARDAQAAADLWDS